MKERLELAILSVNLASYSTRRLKEAGARRGHKMRVLSPLRFSLVVRAGAPELYYRGEPLPRLHGVIPRIGTSISQFGLSLVRQFEAQGVATLNSSLAIARARDKLWTMQLLCHREVGLPATAFARGRDNVRRAQRALGGAPLVVKALEGSQGVGVLLAETEASAESLVEALQLTGQRVVLQELVRESLGSDLRVVVVGGRVVAAMRRKAASGDFRANVHRGARAEAVELSADYAAAAERAAAVLEIDAAGVDLLESSSGPKLLELNASPGLEGIERASGRDVASELIIRLEELVAARSGRLR